MDRFVIPENIQSSDSDSFGAGDTTYLLLQPVWNSDREIDKPVEISIAQDGRIFVADQAKQSILVFDQNGNRPAGFEDLLSLEDDNIGIAPIDVDIDKKMNVFYIDGTQRIFVWNQYWNERGISGISSSGRFVHNQTGVDTILTSENEVWRSYLNDQNWTLADVEMSQNETIIDSLMKPHLFYDGNQGMNKSRFFCII